MPVQWRLALSPRQRGEADRLRTLKAGEGKTQRQGIQVRGGHDGQARNTFPGLLESGATAEARETRQRPGHKITRLWTCAQRTGSLRHYRVCKGRLQERRQRAGRARDPRGRLQK